MRREWVQHLVTTHTSIKIGYDNPNTAKSPYKDSRTTPWNNPKYPSAIQPQTENQTIPNAKLAADHSLLNVAYFDLPPIATDNKYHIVVCKILHIAVSVVYPETRENRIVVLHEQKTAVCSPRMPKIGFFNPNLPKFINVQPNLHYQS